MIDKLEQVELRYEKVNELICEPEVVNDQNQYKELMRELKNLTPVVECFRAYKEADKTEKEALEYKLTFGKYNGKTLTLGDNDILVIDKDGVSLVTNTLMLFWLMLFSTPDSM